MFLTSSGGFDGRGFDGGSPGGGRGQKELLATLVKTGNLQEAYQACQNLQVTSFHIARGARSPGISKSQNLKNILEICDFTMWENVEKTWKLFENLAKFKSSEIQDVQTISKYFPIFLNIFPTL